MTKYALFDSNLRYSNNKNVKLKKLLLIKSDKKDRRFSKVLAFYKKPKKIKSAYINTITTLLN